MAQRVYELKDKTAALIAGAKVDQPYYKPGKPPKAPKAALTSTRRKRRRRRRRRLRVLSRD